MIADQSVKLLKLRPHHILCAQFTNADLSALGEELAQVGHKIKDTLKSGTEEIIEVVEGVDDLCKPCPYRQNDRCQNPQTGEDRLRKLGAIITEGLGIFNGDRITVQELQGLIKSKAPLVFCQTKCRQKDSCRVFERD